MPNLALDNNSTTAVAGVFVSPTGSDTNPGTISKPLATIATAVKLASSGSAKSVFLRKGTYYLASTVTIGPEASGLTIAAYNGEEAVVSGGRHLDGIQWNECDHPASNNNTNDHIAAPTVYCADLGEYDLPQGVPALQIGGSRVTLARYPDADPVRAGLGWVRR